MKIVVLSVPHSGTRFINRVIRRAGGDTNIVHAGTVERANELTEADVVVCAVRHPIHTYLSWKRRRRSLTLLPKCFERLEAKEGALSVLFLCVDGEKREQQLEAISEKTGLELLTDWTPFRGLDRQWRHRHLDAEETSAAEAIYSKHKALFLRAGVPA